MIFNTEVNIDDMPISYLLALMKNELKEGYQKEGPTELGLTNVRHDSVTDVALKCSEVASAVLKKYSPNIKKTNPALAFSTDDPFYRNSILMFRELAPADLLAGLTDFAIITNHLSISLGANEVHELYRRGISPLENSPDGSRSGIHEYASDLFKGYYLFKKDDSHGEDEEDDLFMGDRRKIIPSTAMPHEMFQEACELINTKDKLGMTPAQRIAVSFDPQCPKMDMSGLEILVGFGLDVLEEFDGVSLRNLVHTYSQISESVASGSVAFIDETVREQVASDLIKSNQSLLVSKSAGRRM